MKDENTNIEKVNADAVSPDLRAFELSAEAEDVRQQLEKASPDLKESFADELREFDRAFRAASTALEHSSFSAAVQLYEKALAKSAMAFEAASARNDFLAAQSEMEKALEEADSDDVEIAFPEAYRAAEEEKEQAAALANANDLKMAAKHARAAAKQFSVLCCEKVLLGLKRVADMKSSGKLAESFVLIERVLEWEPENADALTMRGVILDAAKKEESMANSVTSRAHQPGEERIMFLRGKVPMVFCWCPATTSEEWKRISGGQDYFVMGDSKRGLRHVVLTKGFWMGKYAVTVEQFKMLGAASFGEANEPHRGISWSMCERMVSCINKDNTRQGFKFALPTEAQWEYACRAGTTTEFSFGSTLTADVANFKGEGDDDSGCRVVPVGSYPPNAWGLHEMHGNICEWCADWFSEYEPSSDESVTDPTGPKDGEERVLRGGDYTADWRSCSSSCRYRWEPRELDDTTGFRLVCCEDQSETAENKVMNG